MKVPALQPYEGSWVVTRKADNSVIGEFFDAASVAKFNPDTCRVETIHTYLARVNADIRRTK